MNALLIALALVLVLAAVASGAEDTHTSCVDWANAGECEANPGYMLTNCENACAGVAPSSTAAQSFTSLYEIEERDINEKPVDFRSLAGKVVYVVNVASACGYTEENYRMFEKLQRKHSEDDLVIVLAPCNQFGAQEPGQGSDIFNFASSKGFSDGIVLSKADVNGANARPLMQFLKASTGKAHISWNFDGKFLISRDGKVSLTDSASVEADVQALVDAPAASGEL